MRRESREAALDCSTSQGWLSKALLKWESHQMNSLPISLKLPTKVLGLTPSTRKLWDLRQPLDISCAEPSKAKTDSLGCLPIGPISYQIFLNVLRECSLSPSDISSAGICYNSKETTSIALLSASLKILTL